MPKIESDRGTPDAHPGAVVPGQVVKDQFRGGNIYCVQATGMARIAAEVLDARGIGAVPVLKDGELVGLLSERDLLRRAVIKRLDLDQTAVSRLMSTDLVTASPRDSLDACLRKMQMRQCRHLPIVDGRELVGFLSIRDVLQLLLDLRSTEIRGLKTYMWGQSLPPGEIGASWRCATCGHVHDGEFLPDRCPGCEATNDQFQLVSPV